MLKMEDISIFYDNLLNNKPFSFARFNDGEMMGIEKIGAVAARGDQVINRELHFRLIDAIKSEDDGYWVGLPCQVCFPHFFDLARSMVNKDYSNQTFAVVLINRNYSYTMKYIVPILAKRKIIWISGEDQKLTVLKKNFGFNIVAHYTVPTIDGFSSFDNIRNLINIYKKDYVFIMSCGPMSRVLANVYWTENKNNTYLDVGSLFDNFTRNIHHGFHNGNLGCCPVCN